MTLFTLRMQLQLHLMACNVLGGQVVQHNKSGKHALDLSKMCVSSLDQ